MIHWAPADGPTFRLRTMDGDVSGVAEPDFATRHRRRGAVRAYRVRRVDKVADDSDTSPSRTVRTTKPPSQRPSCRFFPLTPSLDTTELESSTAGFAVGNRCSHRGPRQSSPLSPGQSRCRRRRYVARFEDGVALDRRNPRAVIGDVEAVRRGSEREVTTPPPSAAGPAPRWHRNCRVLRRFARGSGTFAEAVGVGQYGSGESRNRCSAALVGGRTGWENVSRSDSVRGR